MESALVWFDEGGPGESDGFMWAVLLPDSDLIERFATEAEANEYAKAVK